MTKPSVQPVPWLLFSAGGVLSALVLPVLVLLFGLAFPLGWISPPAYADLRGVLGSPLTQLALFFVFMLSLFHWAHRFRYALHDGLQIKRLNGLVAALCYGGAILGTAVAAVLLYRLP